jgi:hypothetical protein
VKSRECAEEVGYLGVGMSAAAAWQWEGAERRSFVQGLKRGCVRRYAILRPDSGSSTVLGMVRTSRALAGANED